MIRTQPKAQPKDRCPPQQYPGNTYPKRATPGRLRVFGDCRGIIQDGIVLCLPMAADDKKFISPPFASEESDEGGTNDDQRKWNMEKKDGYKGRSRQRPHHFVLQGPAPDADHCGGDNREHRWL